MHGAGALGYGRRIRGVIVRYLRVMLALLVVGLTFGALAPGPATADTGTPKPGAVAPKGPNEVVVGMYINDIQDLNLQAYTYTMDFYVWMRWNDPKLDPPATFEPMNPAESWGLIVTPLYDEPQKMPDGSYYMQTRFQGKFNNKMPLANYPFDKQELAMEFEDTQSGADELVFVPDDPAVVINQEVVLPGYRIGEPFMQIANKDYPTTFGDKRLSEPVPYSRVTVTVPVTRPAFAYAIKIIFPIFLVAITGSFVFFIASNLVESRIGMAITALLTLVALQFTANAALPQVDYLMMIDALYVISYVFVIFALGVSVWNSRRAHKAEVAGVPLEYDAVDRHDKRLAMLSIGLYAIAVAGTFAYFLS